MTMDRPAKPEQVTDGALSPEGPVCHCGATTVVRFGKHGEFYGCPRYPECDGIASTAASRVSTKAERLSRVAAHAAFDRLWQEHYVRRRHAYAMLAADFHIAQAHIAEMDEATCERVVTWAENKLRELKRQPKKQRKSRP